MGCEPDNTFNGTELDVLAWSQLTGSGDITSTPSDGDPFFSWRPALQTPATSATVFAIAERSDETSPTPGSSAARRSGQVHGHRHRPGEHHLALPLAEPAGAARPPTRSRTPSMRDQPTPSGRTTSWRSCRRIRAIRPGTSRRGTASASASSTRHPGLATRIQDFLIAQNAFDLYMGGVGYALNDDLHVVWTRSARLPGVYPSS